MKQGSFRAVRHLAILLAMMSFISFSVFGQRIPHMVSIILDPFDGTTTHSWHDGIRVRTYEFEWGLDASRFATRSIDNNGNEVRFPLQTIVPTFPQALFGFNRDARDLRSFGIWGRFDRQGHNWIDVFPVVPGTEDVWGDPQAFEIPIPGIMQSFDLWVWGSHHNFTLEAYFRDHNGVIHVVPMGSLDFGGWRNLLVTTPQGIPQTGRTLPYYAGLSFVKFRIWTAPWERVNDFFVYFNQFRIISDISETFLDGYDLADPDVVRDFWINF